MNATELFKQITTRGGKTHAGFYQAFLKDWKEFPQIPTGSWKVPEDASRAECGKDAEIVLFRDRIWFVRCEGDIPMAVDVTPTAMNRLKTMKELGKAIQG